MTTSEEEKLRLLKRYPHLDNLVTYLLQGGTPPRPRLEVVDEDEDEGR